MKFIALAIAILGIFLLLGIMMFSPIKDIDSLNNTVLKEKISLHGTVSDEIITGGLNIMRVSGIEVVCDCTLSFKGKNVSLIGVVEEYNNKKQVRILKIISN